jgi:hypothetical protein
MHCFDIRWCFSNQNRISRMIIELTAMHLSDEMYIIIVVSVTNFAWLLMSLLISDVKICCKDVCYYKWLNETLYKFMKPGK